MGLSSLPGLGGHGGIGRADFFCFLLAVDDDDVVVDAVVVERATAECDGAFLFVAVDNDVDVALITSELIVL